MSNIIHFEKCPPEYVPWYINKPDYISFDYNYPNTVCKIKVWNRNKIHGTLDSEESFAEMEEIIFESDIQQNWKVSQISKCKQFQRVENDEIWTVAPVPSVFPVGSWEDLEPEKEYLLLLKTFGPKKLFVMKLIHELFPYLTISQLYKLSLPLILKEYSSFADIEKTAELFKQLNAEIEIKLTDYKNIEPGTRIVLRV